MGVVAAVLVVGLPVATPPAPEHVFQMVALPVAEPVSPPLPLAEPVAEVPPEPVAEAPPEPEPPPAPEAPKPKPKAVAKPAPPRPAAPAPKPVTAAAAPAPPPMLEYVPPDVTAAYRHNPAPQYPLAARRRGIEGVVVLAVELGDDGRPRQVGIKRSSGFALLDEAAEHAVAGWRFVPAMRGGRPVGATVEVPVRFSLQEGKG